MNPDSLIYECRACGTIFFEPCHADARAVVLWFQEHGSEQQVQIEGRAFYRSMIHACGEQKFGVSTLVGYKAGQ